MSSSELTPHEWFEQAAVWYVDKHQGCPWCNGCNRMYKRHRGQVSEYHCGSCDFYVCHDHTTERYYMAPGEEKQAELTMMAY